MKTLIALIIKDARIFINDKVAVGLTLVVPMVLILIFGLVFGSGDSGPSGVRLIIVDNAQSAASQKLVQVFEDDATFRVITRFRPDKDSDWEPITEEQARSLLIREASFYRYALVFPEDLFAEGFGMNLRFIYNPQNAIENQMVQGMMQRNLFTNAFPLLMDHLALELGTEVLGIFNDDLAKAISRSFDVDLELIRQHLEQGWFSGLFESESSSVAGADEMNNYMDEVFRFESEQIFGKGRNPAAQSVGGWSVMFLLFSISGAATALFDERKSGIFQRLLSGKVRRHHILWSKFFFLALLGLSQMAILITFGHLVFGVISHPSQILPLFVISLSAAAAATAFGMLLASFCKTHAQASGLATIIILSMSALGGAMFPLFMMPPFIQTFISPLTLVYWAMDGILGVLWRDEGLIKILPQCGVLLAVCVVIMCIAWPLFRRGDLFR